MPDVEKYEILILGSGEAGKYLAWTMAKAGHRTAMVERRWLGGSCPNIACLPSKNLIYSARVASLARRGAEFGLEMDSFAISMAGVAAPQTRDGRRAASDARCSYHSQRSGTDHGRGPVRRSENR